VVRILERILTPSRCNKANSGSCVRLSKRCRSRFRPGKGEMEGEREGGREEGRKGGREEDGRYPR
jgi:hypothetical protein